MIRVSLIMMSRCSPGSCHSKEMANGGGMLGRTSLSNKFISLEILFQRSCENHHIGDFLSEQKSII